jgi:uncharacterized protein (TIGR03435 family)
MRRVMEIVWPALVFAATSIAQTATFDVASVKPSGTGATERSLTQSPGARLTTSNATARMLIMLAYQVMPDQISGGPGWLESDGFDIEAKGADAKATPAQFRRMVQSLLADRFQLKVHRVTNDRSLYALVPAKNGPKLVEASGDDAETGVRIEGPGRITGVKATMSMLASALSKTLRSRVVDQTDLKGAYTFRLKFVPDQKPSQPDGDGAAPAADGPSIFAALQEQLGLTLKATRGPVEVLVIDRAEKPRPN